MVVEGGKQKKRKKEVTETNSELLDVFWKCFAKEKQTILFLCF